MSRFCESCGATHCDVHVDPSAWEQRALAAEAQVEKLQKLARKVDAIRNSIVGAQAFNWSEHAYPLVAALEEAGFKGEGHTTARANLGTLLDRLAERETRRTKALEVAMQYGSIDGGHHKMWVIDQMVRALAGDEYEQLIRDFKAGEYGLDTYSWDVGVPP